MLKGLGLSGLAHLSEAPHPNPLPAGEGTEEALYVTSTESLI
jgi:hypothetical protein